tara:strand:- start:757 stop:963 length:207 start_codon:yes stop_codon:yes gene_type:complete
MYYNVRVQFTEEVPTGKSGIKLVKKSEYYLVEAVSVTDAEVVTTKELGVGMNDFEVKAVQSSRFVGVL